MLYSTVSNKSWGSSGTLYYITKNSLDMLTLIFYVEEELHRQAKLFKMIAETRTQNGLPPKNNLKIIWR